MKEDEAALVPVIFDLYLRWRLGAKAVAGWLNERGHRTKYGRPWNHMAVLTVVRYRTYLGEVCFRDTWHPPLVKPEVFAQVHACRPSGARTTPAERPTPPTTCSPGSSSAVWRQTLRCDGGDRQPLPLPLPLQVLHVLLPPALRAETCHAERLPADEVDDAVLDALLATYERSELFEEAIAAARGRAMRSTISRRPS